MWWTAKYCGRLAREAEELCRACAQELAGHQLYIVWASRAGLALSARVRGLTGPGLDLVLRPAIGRRWAGRGAAMVLNDDEIARAAEAGPRGIDAPRAVARRLALSAALHELAHILADDMLNVDFSIRTIPAAVRAGAMAAMRALDHRSGPTPGHGARFIRVAIHLFYRADRCWPWVGKLYPDEVVGRRDARAHVAALGDEPARMAGSRITGAIAAAEPPAAFSALF